MSSNVGEMWNVRAHWKCGVCWNSSRTETIFNDNTEFQDHIGRHCHVCNKEYTSSGAWHRHQSNHYLRTVLKDGGKQNKDDAYCQYCGMVFPNSNTRAFLTHRDQHKLYQCLACPNRFLDFQSFCGHADKCSMSWKKMVCATIIYDCRTCSQLSKGLKELLVHYLRCSPKIMDEVAELSMTQSEIKDAIMRNISQIESQNKSFSRLMIKVPQSAIIDGPGPPTMLHPGSSKSQFGSLDITSPHSAAPGQVKLMTFGNEPPGGGDFGTQQQQRSLPKSRPPFQNMHTNAQVPGSIARGPIPYSTNRQDLNVANMMQSSNSTTTFNHRGRLTLSPIQQSQDSPDEDQQVSGPFTFDK